MTTETFELTLLPAAGAAGSPNHRSKMRTEGRGRYGFLYQNAARKAAQSQAIHTDARLLLLCLGRAGNTGHAMFDPGELEEKLAGVNKTTGELRDRMDRTSVRRAIDRLIESGLASPESSPRCVVLTKALWERRWSGVAVCAVHKTRAPWVYGMWGDEPRDDFSEL